MTVTFEFPPRTDRDHVAAELTGQGFSTGTPPAQIGERHYLEVREASDQAQVLRVEQLVRHVARASRKIPNGR